MPTYYCNHTGCGVKIAYEAAKPTSCPKCKRSFAAAFAPVHATLAPLVATPTNDPAFDDAPVTSSSPTRTAIIRRQQVKSKLAKRRQYYDEEGNPIDMTEAFVDPSQVVGSGEDAYDPREVKRLAQELAASISPDDLVVVSRPEGAVRFQDWCATKPEGQV